MKRGWKWAGDIGENGMQILVAARHDLCSPMPFHSAKNAKNAKSAKSAMRFVPKVPKLAMALLALLAVAPPLLISATHFGIHFRTEQGSRAAVSSANQRLPMFWAQCLWFGPQSCWYQALNCNWRKFESNSIVLDNRIGL